MFRVCCSRFLGSFFKPKKNVTKLVDKAATKKIPVVTEQDLPEYASFSKAYEAINNLNSFFSDYGQFELIANRDKVSAFKLTTDESRFERFKREFNEFASIKHTVQEIENVLTKFTKYKDEGCTLVRFYLEKPLEKDLNIFENVLASKKYQIRYT